MHQGGAEVSSTRQQSPQLNLKQSLWVGAWNVLSLREDDHLSLLSCEKCLDIGITDSLRFGDRIAARSWRVVTPTIGLVALMCPNKCVLRPLSCCVH